MTKGSSGTNSLRQNVLQSMHSSNFFTEASPNKFSYSRRSLETKGSSGTKRLRMPVLGDMNSGHFPSFPSLKQ